MATSLTSEFWKLFAVLLVVSMAVGFVLSAVFDALALRTQRRRAERRQADVGTAEAPRRPDRILVHQ
ncbi:hypothetical protein ACI2L1_30065 [Streptomyces sp. NPDC019531]|uniref:hypothetical protein n=1 Tax=Streptomyces sp. NPDC019531 TaxID=3365062 RepID=UPI00385161A6